MAVAIAFVVVVIFIVVDDFGDDRERCTGWSGVVQREREHQRGHLDGVHYERVDHCGGHAVVGCGTLLC